ncbi:MAG: FHA domain-containing protein, partial [Chloroflexi bacterium]|nr:FHA domain-containing protein [Chloroflexota bacterium]
VDLTNSGGVDKGVSRRHALVVRKEENSLMIVDKDSPNGTYLNGQRLVPNQGRLLRDGDELRLGRLVIRVHFERPTGR